MSTENQFHQVTLGAKTLSIDALSLTASALEAQDKADMAWGKVGEAWLAAGFCKAFFNTLSASLEAELKEAVLPQFFSLELQQLMLLKPAAVAEEQRAARLCAMKRKSNIWSKIKSSIFEAEEKAEGLAVKGGTKPLPPPTTPAPKTTTTPAVPSVTQIPPAPAVTAPAKGGKSPGVKQQQDQTGEPGNPLPAAFGELKSAVADFLEVAKKSPAQPGLVYSVGSLFTLALGDIVKTLPGEQGRSKAAQDASRAMRKLWVDLETQFK